MKFFDFQKCWYCWGWLNISATYIQWLQTQWWELCERKSFSHWLRFVIWTREVLECPSNLKFPRLFSANDPPLSFRRCCTALGQFLIIANQRWKPCNAGGRDFEFLTRKKQLENFDPAVGRADFPRRYSQQMASNSSSGARPCWLGPQTVQC